MPRPSVFSTGQVLSEVVTYIPKGYAAKRHIEQRDADVFKVSKEKLAEMLISDFEENDEAIGVRNDYKIVSLNGDVFVYKKHLGKNKRSS